MRGLSLLRRCYLDVRGRNRCEDCDKVAYETESEAHNAVQQRRSFTRQELRAYLSDCGYWHMTSSI